MSVYTEPEDVDRQTALIKGGIADKVLRILILKCPDTDGATTTNCKFWARWNTRMTTVTFCELDHGYRLSFSTRRPWAPTLRTSSRWPVKVHGSLWAMRRLIPLSLSLQRDLQGPPLCGHIASNPHAALLEHLIRQGSSLRWQQYI